MDDADYFDACYDIGADYLAHYGILGQKWGRRRYQNPDGTLTPLGRERLYGESGKKKVVSGWLDNGSRYMSRLDKNTLKRMISAADAESRLNRYDDKIRSRKLKGKDTLKLEEKRRKVAVNKDLYSEGLLDFEKEVGKIELRKRNERNRRIIGKIASLPLVAAAGIGLGAVNAYLPKIASTAISTVSHYTHVSPLMADIIRATNKSHVMSEPINKIEYPVKTWEDIFGNEGLYDYLKR